MAINDRKNYVPVKPSEITPEHLYLSRRQFLKAIGVLSAGAVLAACGIQVTPEKTTPATSVTGIATAEATALSGGRSTITTDELGNPVSTYETVTGYNNYYEFTLDKRGIASLAKDFKTSPWQIEVSGLVNKPKTFGLEDLLKQFVQEDRVYRMRCVEAWSMVIPWSGFPLVAILKEVEPLSSAKYVRFQSILDAQQMPGQNDATFPWPYQEGLRLDEAMHDLTILATGLYGKPLPTQDGAPVRLVVPWKYGFKSLKAVTKIELVDSQPATFWSTLSPQEYGFYSNVNPEVPHPRWSQANEKVIGDGSRPTLMFNGYSEQVANLYQGMDLKVNF